MVEMTGAEAVVEALKREDVSVIFGIPGGANLPIYDELYDSGIRSILCRHEQSAAHMADGYARASGRVGVCMATSGPGATNLVTGIATAYMDSSPIVAITGQVPRAMIGRDAFQEVDIIGITTAITKYTFQPMKAEDIPSDIKKAFYIASTGRPGPVLVDIPKDVQQEKAEMEFPERVTIRGYKPVVTPHPLQVEKAVDLLLSAERPVLWGGGGVNLSNAHEPFRKIAELLMAPVVTTLIGKGAFPENHPLSLGPIGMHGTAEANRIVLEADCLLAVGVRFSDRSTGRFDEFCPDAKIIHVDIDPSEIGKNKKVHLPIVGDAKVTLEQIYERLRARIAQQREDSPWMKRIQEVREEVRRNAKLDSSNNLLSVQVIKKIRELLPPEGILTTEVGKHQMFAEIHYKVIKPRTWITSTGLGTMGFGFPASIGAKVAKPSVPVVDLAGDGSFCMTENSLAVCVEEGIPVVVVILDNRSLGMVEQWQRIFYNRRYSSVRFGSTPDFVRLAEAYGAVGIRATTIEDFEKAFNHALLSEVVTVIDVPVNPEEDVYPFVPPGSGLKDILYGPEEL
ncbi:MAG: biosynthetic-type acetolactate synthase large subunit [Thaumarchaeota archaeon]|nr:biosynthetic-type acetolactate synthase large subunit [Nitrososphaerota archaeon]